MIIKASIVGATGYTGIELIRILSQHPKVKLSYLISESYQGQSLASLFPHLSNLAKAMSFSGMDVDKIAKYSDIVFLALPHTAAAPLAKKFLALGVKVIDLSADLRLRDGAVYEKWYQHKAAADEILEQAVYGLPEIGKQTQIKNSSLIANPGCYPTASILAVAPLVRNALLVEQQTIILDAKSGISGAGRGLNLGSHYCEVSNSFAAYQIAGIHRHIPEIEQELSIMAKTDVMIQFTPHIVPMPRGLMVTAYCKLKQKHSIEELNALYADYYKNNYFVHVNQNVSRPTTKSVVGSNFCHLSLHLDERTGYLIIISVIDNLIKGASGQAVQNMNLMYGFAEELGLEHVSIYP
jgi:N-acetyl-gamma-glutamyl-phosphate reductase